MARFGPSKAEVAAVEGWLTGSGLAVTKVSDEIGGYVEVRGSLAAAARAFDADVSRAYREDGVTVRAPRQTATAPAGLAADALDVSGLDTARTWRGRRTLFPRRGPTIGLLGHVRPTTARRSRPASRRRTARANRGMSVVTRRPRFATRTA